MMCGVKESHAMVGVRPRELRKQVGFVSFLKDMFRLAANGRKRVELVVLQQSLVRRGWHP